MGRISCPVDGSSLTTSATIEQVPSTVVGPAPAIILNAPTDRYDANSATEHCSCAACTGTVSNGPPIWDSMDHQDWYTWPSGDTYADRGQVVSNPAGASITAPVLTQTQFATPGVEEQDNHAPSQAISGTPQTSAVVQPRQDPTARVSASECLRRLADRYVNDPGSLASMIRLEPGPSSDIQVVIVLEMVDLL